jgi:hypothetical protein
MIVNNVILMLVGGAPDMPRIVVEDPRSSTCGAYRMSHAGTLAVRRDTRVCWCRDRPPVALAPT